MPLYEILCAFTSSMIVSPVMTIIDTSIIRSQFKNTNLKKSMIETIIDFYNHKNFGRPLRIMFTVYGSTYSTANLVDLFCKKKEINHDIPVLLSTSVINILTISYKDKEYSKIFNTKYSVFPKSSLLLFALRDLMTISSCFVFKKDFTKYLNQYMPYNLSDFVASMSLPIFTQIVSTPIHILSIDLYKNPTNSFYERLQNIKKTYYSVCSGRVIRVIPAFCIGGFINDMLRNRV